MRFTVFAPLLLLLSALPAFGQTPAPEPSDKPAVTSQDKISALQAKHALDKLDAQIANTALQFQQAQIQAQNQLDSLRAQRSNLKAAYDKVVSEIKTGVDEKKWVLDEESYDWNPAPKSTNTPADEKGAASKPQTDVQAKR